MFLPENPTDKYQFENLLRASGYKRIIGIDEAGRGSLAGPVVAAAVSLPPGLKIPRLTDSKKLSSSVREKLYEILQNNKEITIGIGIVSPEEIDRINILKATHLAMKNAVNSLKSIFNLILVDGLPVPALPFESRNIIKGDTKCACISAASIVAKVHRDNIMLDLDNNYPGYSFKNNKGYGTKGHLENLDRLGPSSIHRRSFAPIANRIRTLSLPS